MSEPITCLEFERLWNERLDARGNRPEAAGLSLARHADRCESCRTIGLQYQALERALTLPLRGVDVPDGFADRVLAAYDAAPRSQVLRRSLPRRMFWLAAAASVAVGATLAIRAWSTRDPGPVLVDRPGVERPATERVATTSPTLDTADLTSALSDATSATISLAWQASAPAARVGREVLSGAEIAPGSTTLALPGAETVVPASEVWQEVGERVNAGVRPFSGTARSAFGFLLGPAGDPAAGPRNGASGVGPAPRGA
ncbi:MAG: hypothetical protein U0835_27840 [Isosphaeraceae bacterium]